MSFSIFGDDTPTPKSIQSPTVLGYALRKLPVIEHNVSYARSGTKPETRDRPPDLDEDVRFLRLAHEALVATSKESNLIVDPTIQDVLARLQYALSPHGNPIKQSQSIQANENGQLMIQSFYDGFPNLSNDIFTSSTNNHPTNKNNPGWNFLLDKEEAEKSPPSSPEKADSHSDVPVSRRKGDRKFPCSSCNMLFRRSSDLKRHEKKHFLIPANICPDCGKGFARKDALKRHAGTLTCKKNSEKKLYASNLNYLRLRGWDSKAGYDV